MSEWTPKWWWQKNEEQNLPKNHWKIAGFHFQPFMGIDQSLRFFNTDLHENALLPRTSYPSSPSQKLKIVHLPACQCPPSHHHINQAPLQHSKFRRLLTYWWKGKSSCMGYTSLRVRGCKTSFERCKVGSLVNVLHQQKFHILVNFFEGLGCLLIECNWFSETSLHLYVLHNTLLLGRS